MDFSSVVSDFVSLFYPRICFACGNALLQHEQFLCSECLYKLPKTNFHLMDDNPVINQFLGKIDFKAAASCYYFSKGGKVQHLIHQFKYSGFKDIGAFIGRQYGKDLLKSPFFKNIDCIVPVPLHPKKEAIRGYNQSEYFARGLSESMGVRIDTDSLIRIYASETQTHKTRFSRWENVKEIFSLNPSNQLQGKHVLLVDDVITTGSTLEAAGHVLMTMPGVEVSVCSIACALH